MPIECEDCENDITKGKAFHITLKKCEKCGVSRSRLHKCLTCGKKLCGCCSFDSQKAGGRVCPGRCHRAALHK